MDYTDKSLPPIQPDGAMSYVRGDGALVELKITPAKDRPARPAAATRPPVSTFTQVNEQGGVIVPPIRLNPAAKVVTRPDHVPVIDRPRQKTAVFNDDRILDHPAIGGKVTIFVLFYGGDEYHALHKRCLESILNTTQNTRIDIRVGSNALNRRSIEMIDKAVAQGFITKHYKHTTNDYKYPVMREMFYDPDLPITTKWVMWFDDDSICKDPNWLNILGVTISQYHKGKDCHMIGTKMVWTTNEEQRRIMENRPWWRGRQWQTQNGQPSPNGSKIIFSTGGFWAITLEALIAADIPDLGTGLTHTGGDWQIGAQLYQAGYELKQWNGKKQFVVTSSVKRRGVTMPTIDGASGQKPSRPPKAPPNTPPRIPQAATNQILKPPRLVQPNLRRIINL